MAQRDNKSSTVTNRPSSIKFQTSLSHPSTSVEPKPNTRRHLTLPEPLNNYPQSRAELYVAARDQILFQAIESKELSPESPMCSTPHALQLNLTHTELMNNWHEKQRLEHYKKQKHGYIYGTPPPKSPIGLGFPFPPSTQLSSQKSDPPSTKKDNLPDKSKTKESRSKRKPSTAV